MRARPGAGARPGGSALARARILRGHPMTLSVRDLTRMPHLRTRIHAGAAGADRPVAWAHSSEVPDPWQWLQPGDLLMTVGLGVPADPAAQEEWVRRLAAAGVSAVAIGEAMAAPPLSERMTAAADRCELPLLLTATEVPFIELSRAVAAANHGAEQQRLAGTARLYELMRASVAHGGGRLALLDALGAELGAELAVLSSERGTPLFAGAPPVDGAVGAAVAEAVAAWEEGAARPGIARLRAGEQTVLALPLAARMPALLVAVAADPEAPPPYSLLQHAATIVAMEVERLAGARAEQRRLGAEVLGDLLDAQIAPAAAAYALRAHGLAAPPFALVVGEAEPPGGDAAGAGVGAAGVGGAAAGAGAHHELAERGRGHLLLARDGLLRCLVDGAEEAVAAAIEVLARDHARIGVSDPFNAPEDVPSAMRQARWAIEVCRADGRAVTRYGATRASFGPRSVGDARRLADRVLGGLAAYDAEHGTELVATLDAFLRCNRSWQRAARELTVHKQTLVYRIRRVEELTGRRLDSTADVAELWMALRARETAA